LYFGRKNDDNVDDGDIYYHSFIIHYSSLIKTDKTLFYDKNESTDNETNTKKVHTCKC